MKKLLKKIEKIFDKHGEFGYSIDDEEEQDIDPYIGLISKE